MGRGRGADTGFGPDLNACAALVARADPARFRAAMAAPVAARRLLFPLYAFNAEVARAPWVTAEPMIAEMRLQWWRDVCDEIAQGGPVRRHEVATPLAQILSPKAARLLDGGIAARRWDIYRDAFEDADHFERYIDQTSGSLCVVAAGLLGQHSDAAAQAVLRDAGFAYGVAMWLRAIPQLEAAGRVPLLDGTAEGVAALAERASKRLAAARQRRGLIAKPARAALWHIGQADPVLKAALRAPRDVADGLLPDPLEVDRRRLGLRVLTGRW